LLKRFQNNVTRISSRKIEIHEFTVDFINENEIYNCIYLSILFLAYMLKLSFLVFQSFFVK